MARRGLCDGPHAWTEHKHLGKIELQCSKCPATFPCRENCAHGDCETTAGVPASCPVCSNPVAYLDGFHFTSRGRTFRVHDDICRERYQARNQEPEEDETESRPPQENAP